MWLCTQQSALTVDGERPKTFSFPPERYSSRACSESFQGCMSGCKACSTALPLLNVFLAIVIRSHIISANRHLNVVFQEERVALLSLRSLAFAKPSESEEVVLKIGSQETILRYKKDAVADGIKCFAPSASQHAANTNACSALLSFVANE